MAILKDTRSYSTKASYLQREFIHRENRHTGIHTKERNTFSDTKSVTELQINKSCSAAKAVESLAVPDVNYRIGANTIRNTF